MSRPRRIPLYDLAGLEATAAEVNKLARPRQIAAIGGYAMQIYGSDRLTRDLDLLAERMPPNLPKDRRLAIGGFVSHVSTRIPIDVMLTTGPYASLYRAALRHASVIAGSPVRVVRPGYLVAIKLVAGRAKDELDLDFLFANLSKKDLAEAREIVLRHLGQYALDDLEARIAESAWRRSRDPEARIASRLLRRRSGRRR